MTVTAGSAVESAPRLCPLEALYEAPGLATFELPEELVAAYGGPLGFSEPRLYANFVSSLDGVVAISDGLHSRQLIAAASESARFVKGLLRACADAVLVGAGTLHDSPSTLWTAEHAYPPAARLYAELRRRRGRPPQPTLAVLSGSGSIDPQHPGLAGRTLVLTSEQGAARLGRRLPRSAAVVPCGGEPALDPVVAVDALRAGGHELILCEGGPTVFGSLAAAGLVEELFLTLSPLLAGRPGTERRLSLLEDANLHPGQVLGCDLLTVRRAGSDLFLRYELHTQGERCTVGER
jgi:riboflavin biosynthesis pyrimidine reductase